MKKKRTLPEDSPILPGMDYEAVDGRLPEKGSTHTLWQLCCGDPYRYPLSAASEMVEVLPYNGPPPLTLCGWGRFQSRLPADIAVHFYLGDDKQSAFVTRPEEGLKRLKELASCAIGLDFSIKADLPAPWKRVLSYSQKSITRLWQESGLRVIPNIVWTDAGSLGYMLEGYPMGSVVAVSSHNLGGDPRAIANWRQCYRAMLDVLRPTQILRYGRHIEGERDDISRFYLADTLYFKG